MELNTIIVTTTLTLLGILSYRHYDFYKSISTYLAIVVAIILVLHFSWYMGIHSILKNIEYKLKLDTNTKSEIETIFNKFDGNINHTMWFYIISIAIIGVLHISPQIIKSHPYNKTKDGGTNN